MIKAEDCQNMSEIRNEINDIDNQIVKLISNRAEYVKHASKFKNSETAVRGSDRVKQVINSKIELAKKYGASPTLIEKIYTIMIDFFITEELEEWNKIK